MIPRFLRGLLDWRTGAVVVASLFVALIMAVVITGSRNTHDALEARNKTAAAASRRIDLLNVRIENLSTQVQDGSARVAELSAQVAALQAQLEQQGATPVVARTTTTTRPRSTPSTTSTTRPPSTSTSTTSTTRPCVLSLRGRCVTP